MIEVQYRKDFSSQARTLPPACLGANASGWHITGDIHEDYYEWVNEFRAVHTGKMWHVYGDFEGLIKASSPEALEDFLKHHPFTEWDYYDI